MPIFLSGRCNSCERKRKILHNVTKKDSLCLSDIIIQSDLNALVHAVYPVRKPVYLQICSFQQDLTQESPPPRKFPRLNDLLSASQANILRLSPHCLYLICATLSHTPPCFPAIYLELHFFIQ